MHSLSYGRVGERTVFMDERNDCYFLLDPAHERRLRHLLDRGKPLNRDPAMSPALGLGTEEADIVEAAYPAPLRSVLDQPTSSRATLATVLKVARLVRSTRAQLRRLPIERVLRHSLAASGADRAELPPEVANLESALYLSARRLVPIGANCLVDSLSLLRWLDARRPLALLFGVKLDPFAAHCWLQAGELLLNDRVDTVAAFTPVRVIQCSEATR